MFDATGSMVIDIGGGTAEVAVISLGDIVTARSVRAGGDRQDEAIISYIRKKHNLLIGERTAEEIKIAIGAARRESVNESMEIRGRNLIDGLPKNVVVTTADVEEAVSRCMRQIVSAVRETLEKTPPELASDIIDRGIVLTGGGAQLRGLDKLIQDEIDIPVHVADNPIDCVVEGIGKRLDADLPFNTYYRRRKY